MSIPELLLQVAPPSDTWFSRSPEWGWPIVVYFFLGGIAGGAAFLAGLLDLFGNLLDRVLSRIGYLIALVTIVVGAPLLIVDLTQPDRFWHMIWKSDTGGFMFKYYSAISLGIWIVLLFVVFVVLAAAGALAATDRLPRSLSVLGEGTLGKIIALGCAILGAALAAYTGWVLTGTNRPLWGDTAWLTLLFLLSGISAGGAAMVLFGWRQGHPGTLRWLEQMDRYSAALELIVLAIIFATIWSIVRVVWSGAWGAILLVGVIVFGILSPAYLYWRPRTFGAATVPIAAILVLIGGFLLRTVVIMSTEAV